jgi:hypothetical protein
VAPKANSQNIGFPFDFKLASKGYHMKTKILLLGMVVVLAFIAMIVYFIVLVINVNVEINDRTIKINGVFGKEIMLSEITKASEIESFEILGRVKNGIRIGTKMVGDFNLRNYGKTRLYILVKETPYVLLEMTKGRYILGVGKEMNEKILSLFKKEGNKVSN